MKYEIRDKYFEDYEKSLGLNPNRCIDEFTLDELQEAFNAGWKARKEHQWHYTIEKSPSP